MIIIFNPARQQAFYFMSGGFINQQLNALTIIYKFVIYAVDDVQRHLLQYRHKLILF